MHRCQAVTRSGAQCKRTQTAKYKGNWYCGQHIHSIMHGSTPLTPSPAKAMPARLKCGEPGCDEPAIPKLKYCKIHVSMSKAFPEARTALARGRPKIGFPIPLTAEGAPAFEWRPVLPCAVRTCHQPAMPREIYCRGHKPIKLARQELLFEMASQLFPDAKNRHEQPLVWKQRGTWLSWHPALDMETVVDNPDIQWQREVLAWNPSTGTPENVLKYPTFRWCYNALGANPNFTAKFWRDYPNKAAVRLARYEFYHNPYMSDTDLESFGVSAIFRTGDELKYKYFLPRQKVDRDDRKLDDIDHTKDYPAWLEKYIQLLNNPSVTDAEFKRLLKLYVPDPHSELPVVDEDGDFGPDDQHEFVLRNPNISVDTVRQLQATFKPHGLQAPRITIRTPCLLDLKKDDSVRSAAVTVFREKGLNVHKLLERIYTPGGVGAARTAKHWHSVHKGVKSVATKTPPRSGAGGSTKRKSPTTCTYMHQVGPSRAIQCSRKAIAGMDLCPEHYDMKAF